LDATKSSVVDDSVLLECFAAGGGTAVFNPDPFTTSGLDEPLLPLWLPGNGAEANGAEDVPPIEKARACPRGDGDLDARRILLSSSVWGSCSVERRRLSGLADLVAKSPNAMPLAKCCCCCGCFCGGFCCCNNCDGLVGLKLRAWKKPDGFAAIGSGDSDAAFGVSSKSASSGMKLGIAMPLAFLDAAAAIVALVGVWLPS
jgi:hypothetical protein